jgi:hypothetical protein
MSDYLRPYTDAIPINVGGGDQNVGAGGRIARGFYIGGTGDLVVKLEQSGTAVTFKALPVGTEIRARVAVVVQAGTTVTNSLLLF